MRTTRYAVLATLCLAAQLPAVSRAASPAAPPSAGVPGAKPTWTQRMTAPFKTNPFATLKAKLTPTVTKVEPVDEPFDPKKATPELYVGLAQMSQRGGNIAQARQLYQQALAKAPNHREALLGAARMEDREGQLDVALKLYQRAAAALPQDAAVFNDLALCHARRRELPQAHQALEHAIRLAPQNPLYRNNVAKVLVELNAINPAMQHLAAVHQPAVANYNMAVLLTERGRQQEANYFLSQALEIDPQMEPAHLMLAQQAAPDMVPGPLMDSAAAGMQAAGPMLVQSAPPVAAAAGNSAESILPTPEVVATVPWGPVESESTAYPTTDPSAVSSAPASTTMPPQMPSLLPPVH